VLFLPLLVFLAVTFAFVGLFVWFSPTKTEQRLHAISRSVEKSAWTETIINLVGPFSKLSSPVGDWDTSPTKLKFIRAGIRNEDARLVFYGLKTLLPLLFALTAYISLRSATTTGGNTLFFYVAALALFGCYLPNIFLHFIIKERQREIFENFPDAADLMLICVEAGLSLDAALAKVTDEIKIKSVALAEELHLTNLEMRAGGTREKSLTNLGLRTGIEEIRTFATMLNQADKFGTSIGESLRVFSDDLRHKRQTRAEEQAAKVSTKMLFPLVVCIFPSIIMVIIGPAVIQIIRTILPMLNGAH
jgi:tight adherence protein C